MLSFFILSVFMQNNPEPTHEQTFESLFREYYSRLYYYALDWVEEEEVAKDIVSELFSDLWTQYDTWKPDNWQAYLTRAVRNRCLNYLKHKVTERNTLNIYLNEKLALVESDLGAQEELMKRVKAVMESLPPRTRFVVEQCYWEGKKYSELATLMDTTPGMIHKHISKALTIFRDALELNKSKKGTDK